MSEASLKGKAKLAALKREESIRFVMGDARGRAFMWDQWETGGVFRSTFSPDPYASAFNEGLRNAALKSLNEVLAICPELYQLAQSEAKTPTTKKEEDDV